MEYNDYELVYMCQEHDENAYQLLHQKYKPLIDKKVDNFWKRINTNSLDKDDIKQVVLISFDQAINDYVEGENTLFYTFVNICIDRKLLNYAKNINSNKNKILDQAISLDGGLEEDNKGLSGVVISNDYNPEEHLLQSEDDNDLFNELDKVLSKFEKKVLKLRVDGFSYKDIAKHLNRKEKSIDCALQRIKIKIIAMAKKR